MVVIVAGINEIYSQDSDGGLLELRAVVNILHG